MKNDKEKTVSTDWKTFALASSFKKRNIYHDFTLYPNFNST